MDDINMDDISMDDISIEYKDDRLHLRYRDILVVEPEDAYWYHIEPNETLIETFARFFERIGGDKWPPETARQDAELFLRRKIFRHFDLTEEFLERLDPALSDFIHGKIGPPRVARLASPGPVMEEVINE
jgi:hypothetical protein